MFEDTLPRDFKRCSSAKLWILSPVLQRTIRKRYDNNYKDSLMTAHVLCRNTLENWQRMKIHSLP